MTTTLVDDRAEALIVGYEAIDWPFAITFAKYCEAFAGWRVRGIARDGRLIGTAFTRDGELHLAILKKWRKRWVTWGLLDQLFDMPRVVARPIPRSDPMYSYLIRLGFNDIGNETLVLDNSALENE